MRRHRFQLLHRIPGFYPVCDEPFIQTSPIHPAIPRPCGSLSQTAILPPRLDNFLLRDLCKAPLIYYSRCLPIGSTETDFIRRQIQKIKYSDRNMACYRAFRTIMDSTGGRGWQNARKRSSSPKQRNQSLSTSPPMYFSEAMMSFACCSPLISRSTTSSPRKPSS